MLRPAKSTFGAATGLAIAEPPRAKVKVKKEATRVKNIVIE